MVCYKRDGTRIHRYMSYLDTCSDTRRGSCHSMLLHLTWLPPFKVAKYQKPSLANGPQGRSPLIASRGYQSRRVVLCWDKSPLSAGDSKALYQRTASVAIWEWWQAHGSRNGSFLSYDVHSKCREQVSALWRSTSSNVRLLGRMRWTKCPPWQ